MTYVFPAKILAYAIMDRLADPDTIEAIRATKAERKSSGEHLNEVRTFRAGW